MDNSYDVVIIGGGAAGLSAALTLGRARRSVLVIDAGEPRNAPAAHIHSYLGREGTAPGELLSIGHGEVEQYGVECVAGRVVAAALESGGLFVVSLEDRSVSARRVLVTTGLVDDLPDVAGVAQGWGSNVLHCPYCHGWEVQDQAIGILGTSPFSIHQAQLFRQWSADIVLFLHTAPPPNDEVAEQLAVRDIRVVEGEVAGWEAGGVRMSSGELVPRQVLVVAPRAQARADMLLSLGLSPTEMEIDGHVFGTYVASDPTGLTSVPGVWVAGNVTDLRGSVIGASAAGFVAAAAINGDLVAEETQLAVQRHRVFGEAAWDARYRERAGGIWSGNPNPVLVAEAAELTPGSALDVGCGEGADALWLAARGWRVTGADISTVALERAAAHGTAQGLDVEWSHANLLEDPPKAGAFDLVSAHFLQLPARERLSLYDSLAAAVAPGGTLLLVGHHPSDLNTTMHRPKLHDMFFTPEQLTAQLDPSAWEVLVCEARPRLATDPEGVEITINDTVLRAQRR